MWHKPWWEGTRYSLAMVKESGEGYLTEIGNCTTNPEKLSFQLFTNSGLQVSFGRKKHILEYFVPIP